MGQGVDEPETLLECGGTHRRGHQEMRACDFVAAVLEGADQIVGDETHAFEGDSVRHRMVGRRTVGFEAMGECVHAGRRSEKRRKSQGQLRVGDDEIGLHLRVEDDLLVVFVRIEDDRGASHL